MYLIVLRPTTEVGGGWHIVRAWENDTLFSDQHRKRLSGETIYSSCKFS